MISKDNPAYKYKMPILSEKDENCDFDYIGMYSLMRNPKNKAIYVLEEECQKFRKETFENVLTLHEGYRLASFANLFNYYSDIIIKLHLNSFRKHPKIKPIIRMIKCFEIEKLDCSLISFGINKEALSNYLRTGEITKISTEQPLDRDFILYGEKKIYINDSKSIKINANSFYRRFVDFCAVMGIDEKKGILMALEELFKAYPLDRLKDVSDYDLWTQFDRPLFVKRKPKPTDKRMVNLSGKIASQSDDIIDRMNRDPQRLAKKTIDFDMYVNNALDLLNKSVDLKYRDPQLYIEHVETEKLKQQDKKIRKAD